MGWITPSPGNASTLLCYLRGCHGGSRRQVLLIALGKAEPRSQHEHPPHPRYCHAPNTQNSHVGTCSQFFAGRVEWDRHILKARNVQRKDPCCPAARSVPQVKCPKQAADSTVARGPQHRRVTQKIDTVANAFLLWAWDGVGHSSQVGLTAGRAGGGGQCGLHHPKQCLSSQPHGDGARFNRVPNQLLTSPGKAKGCFFPDAVWLILL